MSPRAAKRFTAEVYEGHSDRAVIVPFDPAAAWGTKPRRIGYRKHTGHPVRGTVNGAPFESWIWLYFHEWRMVIPDEALAESGAAPGDGVTIVVRPHPDPDSVPRYAPGRKRA